MKLLQDIYFVEHFLFIPLYLFILYACTAGQGAVWRVCLGCLSELKSEISALYKKNLFYIQFSQIFHKNTLFV